MNAKQLQNLVEKIEENRELAIATPRRAPSDRAGRPKGTRDPYRVWIIREIGALKVDGGLVRLVLEEETADVIMKEDRQMKRPYVLYGIGADGKKRPIFRRGQERRLARLKTIEEFKAVAAAGGFAPDEISVHEEAPENQLSLFK